MAVVLVVGETNCPVVAGGAVSMVSDPPELVGVEDGGKIVEAAVPIGGVVSDAVSITLSVRACNVFSTCPERSSAARRFADATPGKVTIAFSVVQVILFAAKAEDKAVVSNGIMYCCRAA
jgi:hypothetical protein